MAGTGCLSGGGECAMGVERACGLSAPGIHRITFLSVLVDAESAAAALWPAGACHPDVTRPPRGSRVDCIRRSPFSSQHHETLKNIEGSKYRYNLQSSYALLALRDMQKKIHRRCEEWRNAAVQSTAGTWPQHLPFIPMANIQLGTRTH
jgi:hypothetical protein